MKNIKLKIFPMLLLFASACTINNINCVIDSHKKSKRPRLAEFDNKENNNSIKKENNNSIKNALLFTIKDKNTSFEKIRDLIENSNFGIDSERFETEKNQTILILAINNNRAKLVEYLLNRNAKLNLRDSSKKNALYYAILSNNLFIMEMVINANKPMLNRLLCNTNQTPLINAIRHKKWTAIKYLIDSGADVNLCYGQNATTPLMRLSRIKLSNFNTKLEKIEFLKVFKLLLDKNIALKISDKHKGTALDYAKKYSLTELSNLISDAEEFAKISELHPIDASTMFNNINLPVLEIVADTNSKNTTQMSDFKFGTTFLDKLINNTNISSLNSFNNLNQNETLKIDISNTDSTDSTSSFYFSDSSSFLEPEIELINLEVNNTQKDFDFSDFNANVLK